MKQLRTFSGIIFICTVFLTFSGYKTPAAPDPFKGQDLFQTVKQYVALGEHRTGTVTDTATSFWLSKALKSYGYQVRFLDFPIRQFFPGKVTLSSGRLVVDAFPLWWINEQASRKVTGKLVVAGGSAPPHKNDILLIHLPPRKKSVEGIHGYLDSISALPIAGIVAITDNQSGEIQAYNTTAGAKPWKIPIVLIAPKDSLAALALVGKKSLVTINIEGIFRDVSGRNVYGTIGHGDQYIVVSTPISGWFTCGGERGTGLAIWLSLAKWASQQSSAYTFVFTGNSGHEHAFTGAHEYLERDAPPVDKTHLWIHFGAGAATLKWDLVNGKLVRRNVVDEKRRFYYSSSVQPAFEKAFLNLPAKKILADDHPGGELAYVARKGYTRFAGVSYDHPFFHVRKDDEHTTSPEILESTARAFKNFIEEEISK